MKRIFVLFTVFAVLCFFALPCFAEAASAEDSVDDIENLLVELNAPDWLTDAYNWIMNHKDDIMAGILLVAAALYKLGARAINKKIIPTIQGQSEQTTNIAAAAGKITKANKEYFETCLAEIKAVMAEGGEREKVFLQAVEVVEKNKEEYRLMYEQMAAQNEKLRAALMAESQMVYETLMSAKLTDTRKAEIEAQYLKLRTVYDELMTEKAGGESNEDMAA